MVNEAIDKMIQHLPEDKFILKMLEECAELSEVLLKYLTKREGLKPPREKIVEELGDVLFRAAALSKVMGLEEDVEKRVQEKAKIMYNWVTETMEN